MHSAMSGQTGRFLSPSLISSITLGQLSVVMAKQPKVPTQSRPSQSLCLLSIGGEGVRETTASYFVLAHSRGV